MASSEKPTTGGPPIATKRHFPDSLLIFFAENEDFEGLVVPRKQMVVVHGVFQAFLTIKGVDVRDVEFYPQIVFFENFVFLW